MSKNEEKTTAEQVEQAVPAETPEAVEEQAVQSESETAAAAAQPAAPAEAHEDPAPERPKIVVSDSRGLNLRKGPHVSYDAITVLPDGTPVEILDLPENVEVPNWALVKSFAGIGWVNTNFLAESES